MDYQSQHQSLVDACKQGNRKAQFELYNLYAQAMYNTVLRMVSNRADAEDVLQGAFVEVFTRMDTFRNESTIGAWIKRIVVNRTINFIKSRKLQWTELDDSYHHLAIDEKKDDEHLVQYTIDKVKQAVSALPEGYRMVFTLYAFEGYDHEEIAQIMQISEATSKSQYSRAKAKVRELIG